MESLYKQYSELEKSYYEININSIQLFKPDMPEKSCRYFINRHMEKGNKRPVMFMPFKEQYKNKGKHEHTVSLFLLGLLLQKGDNEADKLLETHLKELMDTGIWYDFKYTWFLGCLLHDIASCIEKENVNRPKYSNSVFAHKPKRHGVVLTRFSEETVNNYLKYRGGYDHGIIGGDLVFDRLCKTFKRRTKDNDWNSNPRFNIKKGGNYLLYCEEHLDHFAYIADAIICHNIWMSYDESTNKKYEQHGLEKLIITKQGDKLNLQKYPLQFILCLLDTIEPVKRFEKLDSKTVLENVFIDIADGTIKIGCNSIIKQQPEFHKWFGNISELKEWMNVNVLECKREDDICYIEIEYDR